MKTCKQRQFKVIVEKHADGYVAYPLGLKGVVVGDGNTYDEAVADVRSAIQFHIETFGSEVLPGDSTVLDAFIAEATIPA
jgi:predicted RNase H-like HicB family nuclease